MKNVSPVCNGVIILSTNLRISGPTPLPPQVLQAMGRQVISHRSQEFRECIQGIVKSLRPLFGTQATPLIFTASGTGGLEAAILNTLEPNSTVLAVNAGYFGKRFAEIAYAFGAKLVEWKLPWGKAADPDDLRRMMRLAPRLDAVLITHNESSTGVLSPLSDLATIIRQESDALILVDGVSSVGAIPLEMDAWGIDVIVTASQKALMSPPGLTIIAASSRALAAARQQKLQRYYFDFTRMLIALEEGTTTYTPAVSTVFALGTALEMIRNEGLAAVYNRHKQLAYSCRSGLESLGFMGFADPLHASHTITAVLVGQHQSSNVIRLFLEKNYNIFISQGRSEWKEQVLRIGHMGFVVQEDIDRLLSAIEQYNKEQLKSLTP